MSPKILPDLYRKLQDKSIITTSDALSVIKNNHFSAQELTRLAKRGYLQKIKRGLYAIVPVEFIGKSYQPDKFVVASRITEPYAISYYSALELHGKSQSAFNRIYVSSPNRILSFQHQGIEYKGVLTKALFGATAIVHDGQVIKVMDIERTIIDCLSRPDLVGGVDEFIRSLEGLSGVNTQRLLEYLAKFDDKSLYAKTGFLLRLFADDWKIQTEVFESIQKHIGLTKYYFPRQLARGTGELVKEWNLIVPKYLINNPNNLNYGR
jgi:predicted transcriptional regulator of viral defense system